MATTRHRRGWTALFAVSLLLAACGDDDATDADSASPTSTIEDSDEDGTATSVDEEADEDEDAADDPATEETGDEETDDGTLLEVTVTGGSVTGGGRHEVPLGDSVTIRVTSDVTDHVHLHGYDVMVDAPAGQTTDLTFEATIPGVFEVELEDSGLPLVELEVS